MSFTRGNVGQRQFWADLCYRIFFRTIYADTPGVLAFVFSVVRVAIIYATLVLIVGLFQSFFDTESYRSVTLFALMLVYAFLEEAARWGYIRGARRRVPAAVKFTAMIVTVEFAAAALVVGPAWSELVMLRAPATALHVLVAIVAVKIGRGKQTLVAFIASVGVHASLNTLVIASANRPPIFG